MLIACALALALVAVPTSARAADIKPPAKKDALEALLAALDAEVQLPEGHDMNEMPLFEALQQLGKAHNLTFVINERSFEDKAIKEKKPNVIAPNLRGIALRDVLNVTLGSMKATFLVRRDRIEIVSLAHAAAETKSQFDGFDGGEEGNVWLRYPLVSAVVKEKPLNETVAKLAETYELNVIVLPQAGDARTAFVSARLMNVPADKALELLALQADLRVVKKGNAFVLTSKEHADGLFNEKQDRERQKIELEKFREAPPAPPKPEPKM
jgi:hypothetical protein